MTTTEAHLLELFMRNPRQVLPRSLIYERVWGYDFSHSSNALDVYVGYLRRKTEADEEPRLHPYRSRHRLRAARAVSLRDRLTLVAAGVVAVVVVLASTATYFLMRHELYSQVDGELTQHAHNPQANFEGFNPYVQDYIAKVFPNGAATPDSAPLPLNNAQIKAVAAGRRRGFFRNTNVNAIERKTGRTVVLHLRERVLPVDGGGAVVVARDIGYIGHDLERLRLVLILVSLGGIAVAAAAARLLSNATLAPVRRLTEAAERIAKTGEPSERVPEGGTGELARLGRSFNTMLGSLEESLETQRRFVADASHELRTPLTSLQTNIDVLRGDIELDPEQRRRLLDDLHRESQEMRALIAGLLELARGGVVRSRTQEFQFDELVEDAVERARSRFPAVSWQAGRLEPTDRRRLPRPDGARGLEPARERREVERRRRLGRGVADRRRAHACETTGRGSTRRTGRSSSIASIARQRRDRCPAPASDSRSCARSQRRTVAPSSPRTRTVAARSSG